jgi:hypothetical protein
MTPSKTACRSYRLGQCRTPTTSTDGYRQCMTTFTCLLASQGFDQWRSTEDSMTTTPPSTLDGIPSTTCRRGETYNPRSSPTPNCSDGESKLEPPTPWIAPTGQQANTGNCGRADESTYRPGIVRSNLCRYRRRSGLGCAHVAGAGVTPMLQPRACPNGQRHPRLCVKKGNEPTLFADGVHAVIQPSTAAQRSVSAAVGSVFWDVSFASSARPGQGQLRPYARSSFVFEIGNHSRRPGAVRPACVQRR